ncbi:cystatin domain-containing protein [Limnohabitans sp. T6-20]|uniref:cystatin domain-containing protein n=1 Tax=Limnohabitans sp. T6-20 TaxID=1100725 RepID=UPI000D3A2E69|nr:cystatin domain-containing protein [Limnohabitans sp. T6-20]PUE10502.1 hypothetical protein B9Z33_10625 [Limnohabitans sp. T6-20]
MKLNWTLSSVMAVGVLVACSPDVKTPSEAAVQAASTQQAGEWSQADAMSPDVQEAARFAVQTFAVQSKSRVLFKDVTQARQQVVAGLNYQLQLQVTQDGAARIAQTKVWRKLDGRYELTEWMWQAR